MREPLITLICILNGIQCFQRFEEPPTGVPWPLTSLFMPGVRPQRDGHFTGFSLTQRPQRFYLPPVTLRVFTCQFQRMGVQ